MDNPPREAGNGAPGAASELTPKLPKRVARPPGASGPTAKLAALTREVMDGPDCALPAKLTRRSGSIASEQTRSRSSGAPPFPEPFLPTLFSTNPDPPI